MRYKRWLGDSFSFLYDHIMKESVFPKKFGGDISLHYDILRKELQSVHHKKVLEIATGSGSAINFLPNDNNYTGTDISEGLLRKAVKNFKSAGFSQSEFYVTSAEELPFENNVFDIVLCILSLNFFEDIKKVFYEVKRVAKKGSPIICTVPVPERNKLNSTIRGMLYSEENFEVICEEMGFQFETIPVENGALLYFRVVSL